MPASSADPLAHDTFNDDDGQDPSKSKPGAKSARYTGFLLIFGPLTRLIVFISLGSFNPRSDNKLSHVPCRFYKMGACTAGPACQFSHVLVDRGGKDVCQWYIKGNCKFGHKCALAHVLPGQPMGMDRKNKKAAQLAGQAVGNQRTSKNHTRSNTPQTQQTKEENGEQTPKTRVPKAVQGNISATAPSPRSSEEPSEEPEKTDKPFENPPVNNTLPTPTETPPLPAAISRPLTQRFSTRNTSSDLGYGPIGSPHNSSPARPAFQPVVQFSPGTSPHHHHDAVALSTSPFAAGRTSALTGFPDREGLGHRPIQSASVLPRPIGIQRDSWQRQTGQTDVRTTTSDSDEGDMEEFLPSSLNDLLTPEERKRRFSRSGSSKPAPTQANHQYSRSVPAAGLLDASIWKDTPTERVLSSSIASMSLRSGFGSEGPSPSHFPGTSNASGAFLPQFHRSTNQSARGFVSHSFDQDRDEVGVLPQLGTSRTLRYDNNGIPLGYGSNRSAALGSEALSPSARALQSHAPGQSLPQGLAAGLSRLHLVPPSHRGDLPDLSEISGGVRGLRGHTGSQLDPTFGRNPGILPHANPVSASPRDTSVLPGMLRRQWPHSNTQGILGHSGSLGQGSKEEDEPLFALDE